MFYTRIASQLKSIEAFQQGVLVCLYLHLCWCLFDFSNFSASLILVLIGFLLLALHPELQRVCVFNVLHHGNFCWGLQLHLGLHQGHEIPQGCWKRLTFLKATKTEEGLQTLGTIYIYIHILDEGVLHFIWMCSFPLSIQFTNCDRNQDSLSQKGDE